jgi:hypothetical protein
LPARYEERGYIDDVIMPHATRPRIARALAMLRGKTVEVPAGSTTICRCERGSACHRGQRRLGSAEETAYIGETARHRHSARVDEVMQNSRASARLWKCKAAICPLARPPVSCSVVAVLEIESAFELLRAHGRMVAA